MSLYKLPLQYCNGMSIIHQPAGKLGSHAEKACPAPSGLQLPSASPRANSNLRDYRRITYSVTVLPNNMCMNWLTAY